jgi:transcriptional regulator with XRE-family HTH domain
LLVSGQIRAGRHAVGWSAEQLATQSGVARRTIVSIERENGVPTANASTLVKIQNALEAAGIEFIGTPNDGPGIRIRLADHR